ncbi:MAG: hypothetical protein L3K24_12460 [Gammaproteobacteria bacterium]|nr:hypothetical protein [Gammaproteobacteria bacterium]
MASLGFAGSPPTYNKQDLRLNLMALGDTLYRIHAEFPADFNFASTLANDNNGYQIGDEVAAEGPSP